MVGVGKSKRGKHPYVEQGGIAARIVEGSTRVGHMASCHMGLESMASSCVTQGELDTARNRDVRARRQWTESSSEGSAASRA